MHLLFYSMFLCETHLNITGMMYTPLNHCGDDASEKLSTHPSYRCMHPHRYYLIPLPQHASERVEHRVQSSRAGAWVHRSATNLSEVIQSVPYRQSHPAKRSNREIQRFNSKGLQLIREGPDRRKEEVRATRFYRTTTYNHQSTPPSDAA